ncbi:uncharacterized protein HD556DRAFT_1366420 [Suillus plorans]|uniref:Uncharacterized protein n=1 Tax=Suillus plorans TaxID=116603 RepID=A0A9P7ARS8_9AGAM|nr:uncharacterized protein HD556DRAFT_1366420 [Suillus plorans]KAG1795163.1 hypothetical protein HD556DRAFT_1366420 [Suillus plorans]
MIIALPDTHPADSCLSFRLRLPAQFPSSDDWCWDSTNQLYASGAPIILPTSATILDCGSSRGKCPGILESSVASAATSSFDTSGEDREDGESEADEVIEFRSKSILDGNTMIQITNSSREGGEKAMGVLVRCYKVIHFILNIVGGFRMRLSTLCLMHLLARNVHVPLFTKRLVQNLYDLLLFPRPDFCDKTTGQMSRCGR